MVGQLGSAGCITEPRSAVLGQFQCESEEEITAAEILPVTIDNAPMSFFCLGAFTYKADEIEPTDGRLLVFNTMEKSVLRSSDLHLSLVTWAHVPGCVYALVSTNGLLIAAVNASVSERSIKDERKFIERLSGRYLFPR